MILRLILCVYNEQSPMVPLLERRLFQISCCNGPSFYLLHFVPLFISINFLCTVLHVNVNFILLAILPKKFHLYRQKKSCCYKNSANFVFDTVGMTHGFVFDIRFDDTLTIIVLWSRSFMNSTILYLYATECVSYNSFLSIELLKL